MPPPLPPPTSLFSIRFVAAIFHGGWAIAFASKSLNKTQTNFPNFNRELIAVVSGITCFTITFSGASSTKVIINYPQASGDDSWKNSTMSTKNVPGDSGIGIQDWASSWEDDEFGRHLVKAAKSGWSTQMQLTLTFE